MTRPEQSFQFGNISLVTMLLHYRQINASTIRKFRKNMALREQSFQLRKISLVTMLFHYRQINALTVRKFGKNLAPRKFSVITCHKVQKQYRTTIAKFFKYQPSHFF